MRRAALGLAALLLLPACGGADEADGPAGLVVVSAPLTGSPWVGRNVERGARLAADGLDGRVRLQVLDNGGSPQRAAAQARQAVADGAVAMVTDGVGAAAVAEVTDPARLPVLVVFEGGGTFVDAARNPTLFRLAPADRPMSRRLADYLSEKARRVAVLSDDSGYGREGAGAVVEALGRNRVAVTSRQSVPEGGSDVAAQVVAARRSGAQALVVWARAQGVAAVVRAARQAGWTVPVYAGPTAEDPLVRQRLADHPEWLDGLVFVSFRITSEVGPEPFAAYRAAYEKAYGPDRVGVGDVVAPPDWSTYAYDAVRLVDAARATGGPLLEALEATVITGANGDERGFGPTDREGVSPDDMYFARFSAMRFAPVDDDLLSEDLPPVEQ
ncbi:MAG: amino acid transporter substrate-binding protein [Frankiales bacterium]|nr:amino acid transporter substrate-binding protein [Frankiales bacterium]